MKGKLRKKIDRFNYSFTDDSHTVHIYQQDGPSAPRMSLGVAEAELRKSRSRITELEETLLGKQVSSKKFHSMLKELK